MSFADNRSTAESIADEALIWAMNTVDRINGKGSANHHPELIAHFAAVYVQAYQTGIFEALKEKHDGS
jgi:hypothetical protein